MPDDDLDNLEDQQNEGPKALREALKREQERAQAAQAELDQLKREAAFREAGMNLSNPQHAAMAKGYDGDPAGISEWVGNLGLSQQSAPQGAPDDEQARLERIFNASAGDQGAQVPQPEQDKNDELRAVTDQARREGWTTERYHEAMRTIVAKYGGAVQSMPYSMVQRQG